jgi:hypothetical protein
MGDSGRRLVPVSHRARKLLSHLRDWHDNSFNTPCICVADSNQERCRVRNEQKVGRCSYVLIGHMVVHSLPLSRCVRYAKSNVARG